MKIKDIRIQNFRGITDLNLTLADEHMNVVVGVNGAGKTSVLDAMAILFSWLIARMKSSNAKGITPTEADVTVDGKKPCMLSIATDDGHAWSVCKSKNFFAMKQQPSEYKTDLSGVSRLAETIVKEADEGKGVPVMMYYPVERAIASVPVNLHKAEPVIWDVYKDALSGNSNFRTLFEWYRRQEDVENEMIRDNSEFRDRSLECVRNAVKAFFPGFSELRVRRRPHQAMVVKKGDEVIEFSQLSQGEKCYLALVCDIARRLSMANPNMNDPLLGDGIILIDEVDLHLHPKWQAEVVSKLPKVFPNCQFFLTTHSPLVLSDLRASQILPLDCGRRIDVAFNPYGKQAASIMINYFEMPQQRNRAVACDIEQAFDALRNGDHETFNTLFEKLRGIIGMGDSDMVNLAVEAKRRGAL